MSVTCSRGCCPTQREHYASITIGASATPTRRPQAVDVTRRDDALGHDLDAYKRLRRDGEQPRGIDGCAALEQRAETRIEVETGRTMTPAQRLQYASVMEER